MELINTFDVSVPVDEAWVVLTDLERIAPCLPGAQLQEVEGDQYRGVVKVKVGPITAQFKGAASFLERDAEAHRAVLKAEGRDTGGKGNAAATITAQLDPSATGTHVTVTTDLHITGKVAQFGRGALADVSTKLLKQFVEQLETTVLAGGAATAANAAPTAAATTAGAAVTEAEPVAEPTDAPQRSDAPLRSDVPRGGESPDAPEVALDEVVPSGGSTPVADVAPDAPVVRKIQSVASAPVDLVGTAGLPVLKRLAPVLGGLVGLLVLRRWRRRRAAR